MHLRVLAVGDRQPAWVEDAFTVYARRLPQSWRFRLDAIATARRARNDRGDTAVVAEGDALLDRAAEGERLVLLDEAGTQMRSRELSIRLAAWQADGRDLGFVIGGPDGVSRAVRERAEFCWSLSRLTLPHGLVRVVLAEQLYRAWSLQQGHPYHRD